MSDMFAGSRIKLERADTHIRSLIAEIESFRQSNPYEIAVHEEPSTGMQSLCAVVHRATPEEWSAIIGDAIHNARTALDLLINDLVDPVHRGTATFPIRATPEEKWPSGIPRIKGLSSTLQERLVAIQPYVTGDMTLRDLHILDIEDKHKVLVALSSATAVRNIRATQKGLRGTMSVGEIRIDTSKMGPTPTGISVHRSMGMEFHTDFDVSIEIVFGNTDALPSAPVVPALERFLEAVQEIIAEFTPNYINAKL